MRIRLVQSTESTHQHDPSFGNDILLFATPNITPRFRDCFELVSNRPIQGRV